MDGVVKIKVLAKGEDINRVADLIVQRLEEKNFEVIERTSAYDCKEEVGKQRLYITALGSGNNG